MTNLEIIKYLATNNPTRLATFLNTICYDVWDFAKMHRTRPITDWNQWLQSDPYTSCEFNSKELEEWSKAINNLSIEITYPDNLVIELPYEGKDPNHMWNTDNNFNIVVAEPIINTPYMQAMLNGERYDDTLKIHFEGENDQ